MSTHVLVVISPATTTRPVVISVSQATRPVGSSVSTASRTASETWSATLSGCPSVTDSEVNEKLFTARGRLASLVGRTPAHQRGRELVQRLAGQHGTDALGDRHLDPEPVRELAQHGCSGEAFDDLADLRQRVLLRVTPGDQLAGAPVASARVPAGDDKVAHA